VVEQQDHNVQSGANVMLGFKRFSYAVAVISGVELAHCTRKQINLRNWVSRRTNAPAVWKAVLAP
jgi:hypothetical protein